MNRLLGAFCSFVLCALALSAWACPHLAGYYVCANDDGKTEVLKVTEDLTTTSIRYSFNSAELLVDAQPHAITGDSTLRNGVFRASCSDTELITEVSGQYYDGEKQTGDLKLTTRTTFHDNSLVQTTEGSMSNADGCTPIVEKTECKLAGSTDSRP